MDDLLVIIERDIKNKLFSDLQRLGILYRLFSRVKDPFSIKEKIERKGYNGNGRKIQDIVGYRIVTYFCDDVKLLFEYFRKRFIEVSYEYDTPKNNVFEPLRKNLVCRFDDQNIAIFNDLLKINNDYRLVDSTFEIQFRTTFSEGWHEVDHNMRYKCQNEWSDLDNESRTLNGLYAVMETSDQALKSLFEDLAYHHYIKKNWTGLIRNKFRLNFKMKHLDENITNIFNNNSDIPKFIFKCDRQEILKKLITSEMNMQITMDNIVYLINYLNIKNKELVDLTPTILKDDFQTYLNTNI